MNRVLSLSAVAQAQMIRGHEISSKELIAAHLRRIEEVNPAINAAVEVLAERALAQAEEADRAVAAGAELGPLHGVPFSIKDSIEVQGTVCSAGTLGRRGASPSHDDATLVTRLKEAGAIPIARTNLPDLLFAFESDNLLFGRTNNPYDLTRTSGGSSGGEAALIAACGSPLGLGSDAAGSVRLPAAFCGIAGIKPTSGRLPRTGHFPPSGGWIELLWQIGPMARRVEDLSLAMRLLSRPDGKDFTASAAAPPDATAVRISDLRVAWYTDNGIAAADSEVAVVVRNAAKALEGSAAAVEETRPACMDKTYALEMGLIGADGGDGLRSYLEALGSTDVHPLLTGWLDKLEEYRTDIEGFGKLWMLLDSYRSRMLSFFRHHDVILCPAYTHPALPHGQSIRDENFVGFSHTMAFNVAGLPSAVVRCGESSTGLPIAVQIAAAQWREDRVLAVAQAIERLFGGWKPAAT